MKWETAQKKSIGNTPKFKTQHIPALLAVSADDEGFVGATSPTEVGRREGPKLRGLDTEAKEIPCVVGRL